MGRGKQCMFGPIPLIGETISCVAIFYEHDFPSHALCVAYRNTVQLSVFVARVLPGLWQQAVVPVDVVRVEAQLALLDVLLDGSADLILRVAVLPNACMAM
eukprot:365870-Chlamydomonas_euryale.AAC.11